MIVPDDYLDDIDDEEDKEDSEELPDLIDWAVDFETGEMLTKGGIPYIVRGIEALKVWIYKTLGTRQNAYMAYSSDYGASLHDIRGKYNVSDAAPYVETIITETLTASDYIIGVSGFAFSSCGDTLHVSFTVDTVYGDTEMEVDV